MSDEFESRTKHFGNARRVRQYVDEIIKQQSLRLGKENAEHTGRYLVLLKKSDVDLAIEMIQKSYKHKKGTIGFKRQSE